MGAVDAEGRLLARTEHPTDARRGSSAVLETLAQVIDQVRRQFAAIDGVGVACAGQITPGTGIVVAAPNLGWHDVPLAATLSARFSVPVAVENDVRAAAWGEFRHGAGRGSKSLLAVFVGTGLGSGAVLDERLWRGAGNAAGEVGHTQMVPDGLPCRCGQRGCLEQYVSGSGFQRRFATALTAGVKTRLTELTHGDPLELTASMVERAADEGDAFAKEVWSDATRYLTIALANYVTIVNPEALILGGGVIEAVPRLAEIAAAGIPALTTVLARASLRITRAALGDWSGVVGAAALAVEGRTSTSIPR